MRPALALPLLSLTAAAQLIVDPARFPRSLSFDPRPDEKSVHCEATPFKPRLDFGLRFQSGYVIHIPLSQYPGHGHRWAIIARVTPDGGKPVHLLSNIRLSDIPAGTRSEAEIGGSFLLGEGRYTVNLLFLDDSDRICRHNWHVEARRSRAERNTTLRLAPSTVESLARRHAIASQPAATRPYRITVLVNAAPLFRRATRLRAFDREMLFGTLAPLLELLPAQSVRLVVFNLEQQKRLFVREAFRPEDLDQVAEVLNSLQLGTVDYNVLQNRGGHLNLLADLINSELRSKQPSDAVIFLGPTSRFIDRFPESALEPRTSDSPNFYYVRYRPYFGRAEPDFTDVVLNAVKSQKGRAFTVHTPAEFSKAIHELELRLPGS